MTGPPGRLAPDVYRRRRAAVILLVGLVALGVIAALALLSGRDTKGTVGVPDVIGLTTADATAALKRVGLQEKVVEQDRPGATDNRVADQDPKGGAVVRTGATVSLIVPGATTTTSTRPGPSTTQQTVTTVAATTTQPPATTAAPTTAAPTTTIRPTTTVASTTAPSTTRP